MKRDAFTLSLDLGHELIIDNAGGGGTSTGLEAAFGRPLSADEHVHHKNGNCHYNQERVRQAAGPEVHPEPPRPARERTSCLRRQPHVLQGVIIRFDSSTSNFVPESVCDRFNPNDVLADSKMSIVQHIKKGLEISRIHLSVSIKGLVNVVGDLAYCGTHVKQFIHKTRRREFVHGNCVKVCQHFRKQPPIETTSTVADVMDHVSFPIELSHHVKHGNSYSRRYSGGGFGCMERCARAIKFLKAPSAIKLASRLRRCKPSRGENGREGANSLRPSRPFGLVEVIFEPQRNERERSGGNECPVSHRAIPQQKFYDCHFEIITRCAVHLSSRAASHYSSALMSPDTARIVASRSKTKRK